MSTTDKRQRQSDRRLLKTWPQFCQIIEQHQFSQRILASLSRINSLKSRVDFSLYMYRALKTKRKSGKLIGINERVPIDE